MLRPVPDEMFVIFASGRWYQEKRTESFTEFGLSRKLPLYLAKSHRFRRERSKRGGRTWYPAAHDFKIFAMS